MGCSKIGLACVSFELTKQVASDEEGAGPLLLRVAVKGIPEVESSRLYVLSADKECHGHTGGCPGCAAPASKSDTTTSRTNHSNYGENLDGQGENECFSERESLRQSE